MLGRYQCKKCDSVFFAALQGPAEDACPIKCCICCGHTDLNYLSDERELSLRIREVLDNYHRTFEGVKD